MEQSKHSQGITSVVVHQQPGGNQSHNIFGGDPDADKDRFGTKQSNNAVPATVPQKPAANESKEEQKEMPAAGVQTSVKVAAPPGGRSQITFG